MVEHLLFIIFYLSFMEHQNSLITLKVPNARALSLINLE